MTELCASVLAHQGGWDEIALVGIPILLLALVLFVADRRARRIRQKRLDDAD
ncbi:MAG: hypothetical protein KDB21_08775 [Acidimicrobiales bacterium]|nr:hypothetical protein [Acidimicrobiales bacterium]